MVCESELSHQSVTLAKGKSIEHNAVCNRKATESSICPKSPNVYNNKQRHYQRLIDKEQNKIKANCIHSGGNASCIMVQELYDTCDNDTNNKTEFISELSPSSPSSRKSNRDCHKVSCLDL